MKLKKSIIVFGIIFFIQPIINSVLPLGYVIHIDLCVMMMLALTIEEDKAPSFLAVGFLFALLTDIVTARFIGVTPIAMIITVILIWVIRNHINIENFLLDVGVLGSGLLVFNVSKWIMYVLLGSDYTFLYMAKRLHKSVVIDLVLLLIPLYLVVTKAATKRRDRYFR